MLPGFLPFIQIRQSKRSYLEKKKTRQVPYPTGNISTSFLWVCSPIKNKIIVALNYSKSKNKQVSCKVKKNTGSRQQSQAGIPKENHEREQSNHAMTRRKVYLYNSQQSQPITFLENKSQPLGKLHSYFVQLSRNICETFFHCLPRILFSILEVSM